MKLIAKTFILLLGSVMLANPVLAIDGTYMVVETWSMTLEFEDFEIHGRAGGYTATKHYSGTERGTLQIHNGEYTLINHTGVGLGGGDGVLSRYINGSSIYGSYAFGPGYGASAYGLGFLGAFVIKVPFFDGEIPAFYDFEEYEAHGSSLSALQGGGYMTSDHLRATVSSQLSIVPEGAPSIRGQPQDTTVKYGTRATFAARASGVAPLSYRWWKNGMPIAGATGSKLIVEQARADDAGDYAVTVANSLGSAVSAAGTLAVLPPIPPVIKVQPRDRTIKLNRPLRLTALARGSAPLAYQWFFNDNPIAGADQKIFALSAAQPTGGGGYFLVATNDAGSATSRLATVVITMPATTN